VTPPEEDDDVRRQRATLFAGAAFVVVVILGGWLAYAMHQNLKEQNCILEGRHNCAPIAMPDRN
jgi:hypothetical protein